MATLTKITPCLWFDTEGEAAATFYTSIFENSRILQVTRYGSAGPRPEGTVMTVTFELDVPFDHRLSEGGQEGPCGWLKDKFGLSWQVIPAVLDELIRDPDPERSQRAMKAMLGMGKIDVAELERAAG